MALKFTWGNVETKSLTTCSREYSEFLSYILLSFIFMDLQTRFKNYLSNFCYGVRRPKILLFRAYVLTKNPKSSKTTYEQISWAILWYLTKPNSPSKIQYIVETQQLNKYLVKWEILVGRVWFLERLSLYHNGDITKAFSPRVVLGTPKNKHFG